ncbi:hypothetical protein EJ06DRAFT_555455 [Trichodelitschia bisporula]|uniref:Uncharacterized protein n=1 Tax=Trichodelitschia bisporula TaxID=703511 RepID=A0A6G1I1F7_9PEZI|nr:hypothetical protein EJ06DRAFT_555455 [Trichodelitschia bisporula]
MASTRALVANALRVAITPAPANLAEQREILRILRSHGEIVVFKSLKYHEFRPAPNAAMAIYRYPEGAKSLLDNCPLRFKLERLDWGAESEEMIQGDEMAQASLETEAGADTMAEGATGAEWFGNAEDITTMAAEAHAAGQAPTDLPSSSEPSLVQSSNHNNRASRSSSDLTYPPHSPRRGDGPTRARFFKLVAEPWTGSHTDFLERSPQWGPFEVLPKRVGQLDLARRVTLVGLSDLGTGMKSVPLRILNRRQEEIAKRATVRDVFEGRRERLVEPVTGTMNREQS